MTSEDEHAASSARSDSHSSGRRRPGRAVRETVVLLLFAVLLALAVKTFFVQSFYIPSESMEPGLIVNDRILVEKPSYWGDKTPQRGDVIVFDDPGDWLTGAEEPQPMSVLAKALAKIGLYPTGGHLVKRVVGVPGDTIVCCTDKGELKINGKAVDESGFIAKGSRCDGPMIASCNWTAGPVPAGRLFVMGDNRSDSADSSVHLCRGKARGCDPNDAYVPISDVVGKVFALAWPPSRATLIHTAGAFAGVPNAKAQ